MYHLAGVRYPFVLFDVNETLIAPRESFAAVYARILSEVGFERPVEALESALRDSWEEMSRLVPTGTDRYAFFPGGESAYWLRFASSTIGRAGGAAREASLADQALPRLREAFRDPAAWRVYPDVVPALESLEAAGVRLAVVSNWDSRLPALLDDLGLATHFDAVVVSHLVGAEKPSPEIFRRALAELDAEPASALHVGDLPDLDLAGARAAHIDAVLVDRRGRFPDHPQRVPDLSSIPARAMGE
jgi:putative hydrolase of the HAD superfamily